MDVFLALATFSPGGGPLRSSVLGPFQKHEIAPFPDGLITVFLPLNRC